MIYFYGYRLRLNPRVPLNQRPNRMRGQVFPPQVTEQNFEGERRCDLQDRALCSECAGSSSRTLAYTSTNQTVNGHFATVGILPSAEVRHRGRTAVKRSSALSH